MIFDPTIQEWHAVKWNVYLEEGKLVEVTRHAKKIGITVKVAITAGLFDELAPFAEEATKGHSLEERLDDMFKAFNINKKFATNNRMEFDVKLRHMIKSKDNVLTPEVFKKNADKKITVAAGMLFDDRSNPALVFALIKNPHISPPAA
jgi:hypothetical protein